MSMYQKENMLHVYHFPEKNKTKNMSVTWQNKSLYN